MGGIFMRAKDPKVLWDWYKKHLGIDVQDRDGATFTWTDSENSGGKWIRRIIALNLAAAARAMKFGTEQLMTGLRLRTRTLELVPKTAEVQASLEAMDQSQQSQLSPDWLARFRAATSTDPWVHGFYAVLQPGGEVVGTGGFKGTPAEGTVEIAYGVSADQQSKGYGTGIAAALRVRAHFSRR